MAFGNVLGQSGTALPYINGNYDAGNHNIKNVADPVDETDAVNVRSLNSQIDIGNLFKKNLIHTLIINSSTQSTLYFEMPELTPSNFPMGFYFELDYQNISGNSQSWNLTIDQRTGNTPKTIFSFGIIDLTSSLPNHFKVQQIYLTLNSTYANLAGGRGNCSVELANGYNSNYLYYKNDNNRITWYYDVPTGLNSGTVTISMYWF